MTQLTAQRIKVNGAELDVRERGSGQPVVFVHGGMGDECAAVVNEPALASKYRVIDYHRRGWGNSSRADGVVSIEQQAADCRAVIDQLGAKRAHFVGQSYGGVIILQLALDGPDAVHSLVLLEPPLPSVIFNSPEFGAVFERARSLFESGDKAGAVEAFAREVGGDGVRDTCDRMLPPGAFERWLAAADTLFQTDAALDSWTFTQEDASRITQPVLNITGVETTPYFRETYETLRNWLPQAENAELPNANHSMLQLNPKGKAERLAEFFARHPIQG
jgi:pimeloyl-ACP methyl ester carboxylesterase